MTQHHGGVLRRGLSLLAVAGAAAALAILPGAAAWATPPGDIITRYAGVGGSGGVPVDGSALTSPIGRINQMAIDAAGNLYAADYDNNRILKVTPAGNLSVVAGNGTSGAIVAGNALNTPIQQPTGVAVDAAGNVYFTDGNSSVVAKVTPAGQLSIVVGNGTSGTPTAGPALLSPLSDPVGLAFDRAGNLYIADNSADRVAKVTPAGMLSIVVGGGGTSGLLNAPTPATDLDIDVNSVAVDSAGNMYVPDYSNCFVVKVNPAGIATNYVGDGSCGSPTPGPATASSIDEIYHVSVDANDNLYIGDYYARVVEKITPASTLSVYGNGSNGPPAYGAPIAGAQLGRGHAAVANAAGVLFFADATNYTIDRIGPATPSGPRDLWVAAHDNELSVSFLPPFDAGTTAVTGYEISVDGGQTWQTLATTVSGGRLMGTVNALTNGTTYQVTVRAANSSGASPTSGAVAGTPSATPATATLPVTGAGATGIVGAGLLLIIAGRALLLMQRRRTPRGPRAG